MAGRQIDQRSEYSGYNLQNEKFASRIVDSIVGYYLNYHRCDYSLRAKLCSLCGLSQQQTLIASQQNHLN